MQPMPHTPAHRRAFTLVELSIVLVILGLLVGGILMGQSLTKSAELRSITTEYERYTAAVHNFQDTYFFLPGDMKTATSYWQRQSATVPCVTNSSAAVSATGTCDGDGNGKIYQGTAASVTGELFQFWHQLSRAGLIEGKYTGLAGPTNAYDGVIGTNVPKSRFTNGGWGVQTMNISGNASFFTYNYENSLTFGAQTSGGIPQSAVLKPEEAWNIDTKVDDGYPAAGKVFAIYWNNACASASSATDYESSYNLAATTATCALIFHNQF